MQRNIIVALAVVIVLLGAALAFVLLGGQTRTAPAPVSINAAEENASEPYHQEMDCIDRLLQSNELTANEVGPALTQCQSGPSGNQSSGR